VHREEAQIVKILASFLRCDQCKQSINAEDIGLVGQKENWWFFMVRCTGCGESRVVAALVQEEDDQRSEAPHESEALNSLVAVTSDEVLDTHVFLRDFDGDFKSLFTVK
jgi:hypothetical protein